MTDYKPGDRVRILFEGTIRTDLDYDGTYYVCGDDEEAWGYFRPSQLIKVEHFINGAYYINEADILFQYDGDRNEFVGVRSGLGYKRDEMTPTLRRMLPEADN